MFTIAPFMVLLMVEGENVHYVDPTILISAMWWNEGEVKEG